MLAFVAIFFPAAIMVAWKKRLFKEDYDWMAMLMEYIAGVVLINFLVIAVAYFFFGSRGDIVSKINTYNDFALKYLFLSLFIAFGAPWIFCFSKRKNSSGGMIAIDEQKTLPHKKRIKELDFIRAISALGIVGYHFSTTMPDSVPYRFLHNIGNTSWGTIFVTVFFALSGFSLTYSNQATGKRYFSKRALSIFPTFYIAFLYYFLRDVLQNGKIFYKGVPQNILFSLFGMDGYFLYKYVTYYQVGEWFLGALILLYILYPLLRKALDRAECISSVCILGMFVAMVYSYYATSFWQISYDRNLISCLFPFWIGMVICKHRETVFSSSENALIRTPYLYAFIGVVLFAVGYFMPFGAASGRVMGIGLFLILYFVGKYFMMPKSGAYIFGGLAALSYPIFLVQHKVISDASAFYTRISGWVDYFLVLACVAVIIIIYAWALEQVSKAVMSFLKSKFVNSENTHRRATP